MHASMRAEWLIARAAEQSSPTSVSPPFTPPDSNNRVGKTSRDVRELRRNDFERERRLEKQCCSPEAPHMRGREVIKERGKGNGKRSKATPPRSQNPGERRGVRGGEEGGRLRLRGSSGAARPFALPVVVITEQGQEVKNALIPATMLGKPGFFGRPGSPP